MRFRTLLILLILAFTSISSCSLYRSEGREKLESEAYTFAAEQEVYQNSTENFMVESVQNNFEAQSICKVIAEARDELSENTVVTTYPKSDTLIIEHELTIQNNYWSCHTKLLPTNNIDMDKILIELNQEIRSKINRWTDGNQENS